MKLFGSGRKQEEAKVTQASAAGPRAEDDAPIKVLGAGCKACHAQYENVLAAVSAMGLKAEVAYVTDMAQVMTYGVMSMPAIVVNGKVVASGRVLKAAEVEKLLGSLEV
ncbi:MAG: thioredoxin family protein [Aristaeellaceae bacterium]